MAEIAGLVVGGIPLAIWVLERYSEPYEAYTKYHTSIETLREGLILQRKYLQTTLFNIGLPEDPSIDELRENFKTKFPDISQQLMSIIHRMDNVTAELLRTLDVDIHGRPEALPLPEKAKWEWRRVKHGFRCKQRTKVVDDLRKWNEDLRRAVEKPEVPASDDSRKVQQIIQRFNPARSNAIRQCLASFHRALELGFRCGCSTPHEAAIDLDWASYESDSAKTIKVAVSYETSSPSQGLGSWRKLEITSETVVEIPEPVPQILAPSPPAAPHSLTPPPPAIIVSSPSNSSVRSRFPHFRLPRSLSPTPPPPPATIARSPIPTPLQELAPEQAPVQATATSLCAALCTNTNPWPLIRFLKDPNKEGKPPRQYSLHNHPVDSPDIIKAVPLKSLLLSREQRKLRKKPHLALTTKKQAYGIAATIAWSVLHLACSPWLDDHWDQKQVSIFLEKDKNDDEVLSRHPCASYVFSPRAPENEDETRADDLSRLVPNKTIFALGILLIELCLNEPVYAIQEDEGMPPTLFEIYDAAVDRLEDVYFRAGNSYGDAAQRCVRFSFGGTDWKRNFKDSKFRENFYNVVVAPVQATYLMCPE